MALLREGANVVIASRRAPSVADAVSVICDVRKESDVIKVAETAQQPCGSIDILVNNSGLGVESKIVDCPEEDRPRVSDVESLVIESASSNGVLSTTPP